MTEQMKFPETFERFAKTYGFKDDEEVYTNGLDLIPIFRVKQWLEHNNKLRAIETDTAARYKMVKRKCKSPNFDVIVCCQGQPFHYYHSTLIGALVEYGYQYIKKGKYETMNFSLKQVFNKSNEESEE